MLRPASASSVHRRMLIGRSLPSQPAFRGTVPVPARAWSGGGPPDVNASRYPAIPPVPSGPGSRSARITARRRCARSQHPWLGCRYAPRPGITARGSGTISSPEATRRSKSDLAARLPHPTHVRITGVSARRSGGCLAIALLILHCRGAWGTARRGASGRGLAGLVRSEERRVGKEC